MEVTSAEAQLNALIERWALQAADEQRVEEAWTESERRERERRRRENRQAWSEFYSRLARAHAGLSRDFQRRAEAVLEELRGEGGLLD